MKITFKQKIKEGICSKTFKVCNGVRIPKQITSAHYDRAAVIREHDKPYCTYVNSDMMTACVNRGLTEKGLKRGGFIPVNNTPDNVTIDTTGFLAVVTIEI